MALAVGIYLPAYLGIGILIGSLCRYFGERARETDTGRRERTHEGILAAAAQIESARPDFYAELNGARIGKSPNGMARFTHLQLSDADAGVDAVVSPNPR